MKSARAQRTFVSLFFVLLLAIGIVTLGDYTGSYDELVQQDILRINLHEYAVALERVGIRWEYGLGLSKMSISQYIERDHGIAGMYVCAPLLPLMRRSSYHSSMLWGGVVWLWFMVGVISLYMLARHMGLSRFLACLTSLVLYLSPRLFAQGHYNDKDIVLLSEVLLCLWLGVRFLDKMTIWRGLWFSLAGALAANLRIVGLLPWGAIGLCAVIKVSAEHKWSLKTVGVAAATVAAMALWYVALTPAIWADAGDYFTHLLTNTADFRWAGTIIFRDAEFYLPENRLPFYYIPYMMLVTLPLYTFPLCALGQMAAVRRMVAQRMRFIASKEGLLLFTATLMWLIPFAGYAVTQPVVYNGWRHFYFCYAGIALLCGYGMQVLWRFLSGRQLTRRLCAVGLCLLFVTTAVGMALNHPGEAVYYNLLAKNRQMETDYWNSMGTAALKRLYDCDERNKALPMQVGCYFWDNQNAAFKLTGSMREAVTTNVETDAPYLYYNQNYVDVYGVPVPQGYHRLFEITSYGRVVGVMYEQDAPAL